jgi:hypothetical protein
MLASNFLRGGGGVERYVWWDDPVAEFQWFEINTTHADHENLLTAEAFVYDGGLELCVRRHSWG